MNLKDLKNFITYQIDDRLAECGIDSNQIIQIKIQDRKLPPDDNVVWNVVWKLKTDNLDYLDVLARIEQWINNEIIFCYMNDWRYKSLEKNNEFKRVARIYKHF